LHWARTPSVPPALRAHADDDPLIRERFDSKPAMLAKLRAAKAGGGKPAKARSTAKVRQWVRWIHITAT
jgi:hypothetical protein